MIRRANCGDQRFLYQVSRECGGANPRVANNAFSAGGKRCVFAAVLVLPVAFPVAIIVNVHLLANEAEVPAPRGAGTTIDERCRHHPRLALVAGLSRWKPRCGSAGLRPPIPHVGR